MALFALPSLDALKDKLQWHAARHKVLAENVANADVPGFQARDLKPFAPRHSVSASASFSAMMVTHARHIPIGGAGAQSGRHEKTAMNSFEVTPSGNSTSLEEHMMLFGQNQIEHEAAVAAYQKSHQLLRLAVRR